MDNLNKLNDLFNSKDIGIAILNVSQLDSFFYKMNDTLKKYLQYSEEEINVLNLSDISHPDDLTQTMEYGGKILSGEINEFSYKKRYVRKDNTIFWGLTTVTRISDKYLLFVVQDISHYEELQQNIHNIIDPLTNDSIDSYCARIKKINTYNDEHQRRKYFRFKLPQPICTKLSLQQTINGAVAGFSPGSICIQDISGGGLCFLSDKEIPVDDSFDAVMSFKLIGTQLHLTGKIVRSYNRGKKTEYGVEFDIEENDRDKLISILHNLSILTRNRIRIHDTDFCRKACIK